MSSARSLDGPPPELAFKRKVRIRVELREVWRSRGLIRTLAERDLRVRYKQAVLGFLWAILMPFVLMVVFSVFFQRIAHVDTGGAPYPLFAYLGLIPWGFFSSGVSSGGMSILSNGALLNKVYCPREVFPIAALGVTAVDTAVSTLMLVLLFIVYTVGFPPSALLWIPPLLFVLVAFTLGVAMLTAGVVVYFRDLRQVIPVMLQFGLFATPVAYGMEFIPRTVLADLLDAQSARPGDRGSPQCAPLPPRPRPRAPHPGRAFGGDLARCRLRRLQEARNEVRRCRLRA